MTERETNPESRGVGGAADTTTASDIPERGLLVRLTPPALLPYLRLGRFDRLIGAWILVFPCWWSVVLASPGLAHGTELLKLGLLFLAGAVVMRGAGCTVNDIIDRDIDRKVARTRTRPVASGAVSVPRAFMFLALLLAVGLAILLAFNRFTIMLAVGSLALVMIYPFMKRITWVPQAWLGITMTFGSLLGFAAVQGKLAPEAFLLYAGAFFWTLGYDTIYAFADIEDDKATGVKTLSLVLGPQAKPWFTVFYTIAVALFGAAGYVAGLGFAFWPSLGVVYAFLLWQAWAVDLDDPADCMNKFRATRIFLVLLLATLLAGQITA